MPTAGTGHQVSWSRPFRSRRSRELNLLDWELDLAPKEKKTIRFEFVVEYPQEMRVMGLP
jgi:hypothetical protein